MAKSKFAELEEKILKFWKERDIFRKVQKQKKKKTFSFYDGPPFASGKPHHGHILATAIKDTVTRYWSMRGYAVDRRVGWDCHGLPVENLVEREEGIKNKKEITDVLGVEKFNELCRASVFRSVSDFVNTLTRFGRWADYERAYATLENNYIESVWWVFKKLYEQGLVYQDFRVSPYCPRCATPLSNFEVNQGYKEVEDNSVYVKFRIKNPKSQKLEANSYFLVWTTTPWTLPANVALAVNPKLVYAEVKHADENGTDEYFILAKERVTALGSGFEIVREMKGKELAHVEYEPLFRYHFDATEKGRENVYHVIGADFVSSEDGTGIVHIAPAFGEDDAKAGKTNNLPTILNVDENGRFGPFRKHYDAFYLNIEGKPVKAADALIIEELKRQHLFFKEEKIKHNYPFCWRCGHYLLYYAVKSWYVATTKIKKELIANNKKINWVPAHIKTGRFGKWLEEVKDWGISRNRFWGAPIPVWQCEKCHTIRTVGGLEEMKKYTVTGSNSFFILRHGEAESNVEGFLSSWPEKRANHLTTRGVKETGLAAKTLKKLKIDLIISSDLTRARETAEIIAKELSITVHVDERLREYDTGALNGMYEKDKSRHFKNKVDEFIISHPQGESLRDVRRRMIFAVRDINKKHEGKKILLVSHGDPLWLLEAALAGKSEKETIGYPYIQTGEVRRLAYWNGPFDKNGSLDFHRPYIDEVKLACEKCNSAMARIEEVFDCWFESGSMPYAQYHYPFENKKLVEKTFPADFIAEGLDQTRGWFYTLHVLASALTEKNIGLGKNTGAFKNVIVNGLVLAEDGRKLSKMLKNYREPEEIMEKYGADSLRYFLLASTPIGEDYRFSEKGVADVSSKVVDTLLNTYNFLTFYAPGKIKELKPKNAKNILDKWILIRLGELLREIYEEMERYELTRASRLLATFVEDLSNWYVRRSRRRFQQPASKEDFEQACATLYFVLREFTKISAPFLPFASEYLYQELKRYASRPLLESVHFDSYPKKEIVSLGAKEQTIIEHMNLIKEVISKGKKLRAEKNIRVRQPIATLKFSARGGSALGGKTQNAKFKTSEDLLELVKDELNVKKVVIDNSITSDVWIDEVLTPELKEEGTIREIIRVVQEMRKDARMRPKDIVVLHYRSDTFTQAVIKKYANLLEKEIKAKKIKESGPLEAMGKIIAVEQEFTLDTSKIWLGIERI